jgi:hypothetical protein
VRIASWVFLLCAVLSAAAVFMPALEIQIGGTTLGKHMSLSLYETSTKREQVRHFFEAYNSFGGHKKAEQLLGKAANKLGKRVKSRINDVRDAMETMDDVRDEDIETVATILQVTMWSFLALTAIMIALVFVETIRKTLRRSRIIIALAMSLVAAVAAVGIHIVFRKVVAEANDEIGGHPFALSGGAYVLPIVAVGAFVAIIVTLVLLQRNLRAGSVAPQPIAPPGYGGPIPPPPH